MGKSFFVLFLLIFIEQSVGQHSKNNADGIFRLSSGLSDKTVNTNVYDAVKYNERIVYVYASMTNDAENRQTPSKWIFFYVPLMWPIEYESTSPAKKWIELAKYNRIKIHLTQGDEKLEQIIRETLASKVNESIASHASKWTILPLMIDSLTAYIVKGKYHVAAIEHCDIVNPSSYTIKLVFRYAPEEEGEDIIEKVLERDYEIELAIRFSGFAKGVKNVVSYSYESFQKALSEKFADGPASPKYILRSQKNLFAQEITTKTQEMIYSEDQNRLANLESLRSIFMGFIELAIDKSSLLIVEIGQLSNVWSTDDFKPDLVESELNKMFKLNQEETDKRDDGDKYFEFNKVNSNRHESHRSRNNGIQYVDFFDTSRRNNTSSSGNKLTNQIENQFRGKNQNMFSETEIKQILYSNSFQVEWNGYKFVAKSITVVKISDVVQNTRASLVSKQIAQETEQQEAIIKRVDLDIVKSEFFSSVSSFHTIVTYRDVNVQVYSSLKNQNEYKQEPTKWSFFFVPLMIPAEKSSDNQSWIKVMHDNQVRVQLIQFDHGLRELIRESLIRKEQEENQKFASSWDIQPLLIDKLIANIKYGESNVENISSCNISSPNTNIINIQFTAESPERAYEVMENIVSQKYLIELAVYFSLFRIPRDPVILRVNTDTSLFVESDVIIKRAEEAIQNLSASTILYLSNFSKEMNQSIFLVNSLSTALEELKDLNSSILNKVESLSSLGENAQALPTILTNFQHNITSKIDETHSKVIKSIDFQFDSRMDLISATADIGTDWGRLAVLKHHNYVAAGHSNRVNIYNSTWDLVVAVGRSTTMDLKPFKNDYLIQASDEGIIEIWNVKNGELLTRLHGHDNLTIESIALNKNESLMLSGAGDTNIIMWNMVEYTQIRKFTGHTGSVEAVIFNEENNQVISGSGDTTIRVWDINNGSLIKTLTGHTGHVEKLLVDEKTGLLYSSSTDATIREWDINAGICLKTFTGHKNRIDGLLISENGLYLVSSSFDNWIIFWDIHSSQMIKRLYHKDGFYGLAIGRHNQLITTSRDNGKLISWSVKI